ncbi:aminotransferase class I/II-fold pyridoxal phosphate-dependent enzyme [Kitasatospora sp. SUK 42]|uniref:aminotransferase class I/II-fold pyridoxal phosphate-dependent enzyme n=1 Tax=Kitasatospora sp. SUK 42 TaxID=1588882 RepID=UPI0018CAD5E9|nr:aminotransferase class I/II-fold pyridoxal phosphate-dependent enzyme [Kitasatospora sp. SUK 42]MBV2156153.1 aminotransferase class I/II-fold pyridoxal phosphate-dependent enzyme [Kitasatospora sp. SUK 42]
MTDDSFQRTDDSFRNLSSVSGSPAPGAAPAASPSPSLALSPAFDFDAPFDRAGTGSSKWARATAPGVIPMGLADMDLPAPPAVAEALERRARHRAYGYTVCDPAGRTLVADWYRARHGVEVDPDWVLLLPCGPRTALRVLLETIRPEAGGHRPDRPQAPVLFPTPEWGGFAQLCRAARLDHLELPLPTGPDGYRLPDGPLPRPATAVLLSSPHNPSARVWPAAELHALAERAAEADALLVSDEVHGDLTHPGHVHPVAATTVDPALRHRVVTLNSVGKTFNCSGIPSSFALVPDPGLRARLTDALAGYGLWEGGLLEQTVQQAALREGGPWLDALLAHLAAARTRLTERLGAAVRSAPHSSYLLWLDAAALGLPPANARQALLERCGLESSDGADFGPGGRGSLRLNYALPGRVLDTVLTRLDRLDLDRPHP